MILNAKPTQIMFVSSVSLDMFSQKDSVSGTSLIAKLLVSINVNNAILGINKFMENVFLLMISV